MTQVATVNARTLTTCTFANGRFITSADDLPDWERRQLVAVGVDGVGGSWDPERLLEDGRDEGFSDAEVWDVFDANNELAYRVWIYGTDNGTVVRGQTLEIVAGMSQGYAEINRKKGAGTTNTLIDELVAAVERLPQAERPKGSCVRFFRA
jgi:hypothetical protein